MIEFRILSDAHPDLKHSPLLRAALSTLQYAQEHGATSTGHQPSELIDLLACL
jgi:hypothetical protein